MLDKVQEAGYGASKKTHDFYFKETTLLGHEINEHGIKPIGEKIQPSYI